MAFRATIRAAARRRGRRWQTDPPTGRVAPMSVGVAVILAVIMLAAMVAITSAAFSGNR